MSEVQSALPKGELTPNERNLEQQQRLAVLIAGMREVLLTEFPELGVGEKLQIGINLLGISEGVSRLCLESVLTTAEGHVNPNSVELKIYPKPKVEDEAVVMGQPGIVEDARPGVVVDLFAETESPTAAPAVAKVENLNVVNFRLAA